MPGLKLLVRKYRMPLLLSCLFLLSLFFSSAHGEEKRRRVQLKAPLDSQTINLAIDEPAAMVILKGWYSPLGFQERTIELIRFFNWAATHVVPPAGDQKEPHWKEGVRVPSDILGIYRKYFHGRAPLAVADVLRIAHEITTLKGRQYAPGSGMREEKIPGLTAFWGLDNKGSIYFLADAPVGETKTRIINCYSEGDLKILMDLQIKAAREFINAATQRPGEKTR